MTILLDTGTVTPSIRPDYWSAGMARHFFSMRLQPRDDGVFAARLTGGDLGPVGVRSIRAVPHRVARAARLIAPTDPAYLLLYLVRHGECRLEQDDRSCLLRPGDIALQATWRPSAFEARDGLDVTVFSIPTWFLRARPDDFARMTAIAMTPRGAPVVRMAVPFLTGLTQAAEIGTLSERERDGFTDMLGTLLDLLRGADDGAIGAAGPEGSDELLARMRRYVMAHLHDPGLGPEQIASAHYVSTRYVHKLFAAGGTTVSAWIRAERMERAAQELRASGESVAQIGSRLGYRDAASFSRAFRRAHGRSPRDVRAAS